MKKMTRMLSRLKRNESGSIFVETGLVVSFLVLFLLFVYDVGGLFARQMQITNALRAGSQYALVRKPVAGDYTSIKAAILNASPDPAANPTITATVYCKCGDGAVIICDTTCSDGSDRESFLTVTYKEDYSMFFKYPGVGQSVALGSTSTVRLN